MSGTAYIAVSDDEVRMAQAAVVAAWEESREPHPLFVKVANAYTGKADPFITPAEIAQQLNVSKMHVYRLLKDGAIHSSRFGRNFRVRLSDFKQYVEDSEIDLRGAS